MKSLKVNLFIIIYLSITNCVLTQNSSWELGDNSGAYFTMVYEDSLGNLIAAMNPINNFTKVVKLDKNGKQLYETGIYNDSLNFIVLKILFVPSTQKYLFLGRSTVKFDDDTYKYYFVVSTMDSELNLESVKPYQFDVVGPLFNMNYYFTKQEDILLSVNIYRQNVGISDQELFLKLNKHGEIVLSNMLELRPQCYSIIEDKSGYMCVGALSKFFDFDFNYVSSTTEFINFIPPSNQFRALRIGENKILFGSFPVDIPELENGGAILFFLDNELNKTKQNYIISEYGPTLPGNVFDISPDSSIFIANHESPFSGSKSFSVGKFDSELNLLWQVKHSRIGEYRYFLWGMEATHDNGIIIHGSRLNWNPGLPSEAYMVKYDSNGKLVFADNVDPKDFINIHAYPNPTRDVLNINLQGISGTVDIRIFDQKGRNVYVHTGIGDGENILELSGLSAGTYIYQVYSDGKTAGIGSFVKVQ